MGTGGLLEVKSTERVNKYSRIRSASLTAFRNTWEEKTVQFIHWTARSYFSDTSAGHGLGSSSLKSREEIQKICFEVTLATKAALNSLESLAPPGLELFERVLHNCCECSYKQRPLNRESLNTLFDSLLKKGLLSIDPDWVPTHYFPVGINSTPLLSTNHGTISYCHLYALFGLWQDTEAEYQTMNGCKDVKYLTFLVAYLLGGVIHSGTMHKDDFDGAIAL